MKTLTIYKVMCDEYRDTRMGGSNPYYQVGKTCTSLEGCKEEIVKFLKNNKREIPKFEIKDTKWNMDFRPWIMSIKSEEIDLDI